MEEKIIFMGLILIAIGIILLFIGTILSSKNYNVGKTKTEIAIGGFVGPIPFGFFTSKRIFLIWLILFILFLAILILLRKFG